MTVLMETALPLPLFSRGKVRDTYNMGEHLLMVATDRISAFDSILPCGIPGKGVILNQLSAFWFKKTSHIAPHHMIEVVEDVSLLNSRYPQEKHYTYPAYLSGRAMIVKRADVIPVECVVRGYLAGSAWEEYRHKGTINSVPMPHGLKQSQELPHPIFTPSTKSKSGHDLPLSPEEMLKLTGKRLAQELEERSIALYSFATEYARNRGVIIADTKLEFGRVDGINGNLILIDELLTPDSSRFWYIKDYQPGQPQPAFDKQLIRDWLIEQGWDKESPAPMLSEDIIMRTAKRYHEIYQQLTERVTSSLIDTLFPPA